METLATRYAQALLALAVEENKVEEYQKEARQVYQSLKENPGMVHLLSSYFLTESEKDKTIDKIYGAIDLEELRNFIKVVCKNGRSYMILSYLRAFDGLCNEYLGIVDGVCYSTLPLEASQLKEIEKAVGEKEGLKVRLVNKIDKSLIGGLKIVIGNRVIDASIQNTLEKMKSSLMK
jgi:F-type H+-transporting ATPase subunit delta